jgi:hypothetical protein
MSGGATHSLERPSQAGPSSLTLSYEHGNLTKFSASSDAIKSGMSDLLGGGPRGQLAFGGGAGGGRIGLSSAVIGLVF